MPKGRSYAADPWDSYEKGAQTFVNDDFVHDKTFVFKAKIEKENEGINIKESISEKAEGLSGAGEVKFWLNFHDMRSFYLKLGSSSNLNIQFDNGVRQFQEVSYNLFAGIATNRTFAERIFNAGLELFKKKEWALGCRVSHNLSQHSYQVDNKALYSWNNWKVNAYNTLDITNKLSVKSGLLIARTHAKEDACKCDWFLRFEGAKQPGKLSVRQFFDNIFFSVTEQVTDTQKVGVEVRISKFRLGFLARTSLNFYAAHGSERTISGSHQSGSVVILPSKLE